MNYLDRVEIDGFWGDREFFLDFNTDVNFLIGVNGSGKTTVIEMIAAVLKADFKAIGRLPFKRIKLRLKQVAGSRIPSIEIEKKRSKNSAIPKITFRIKEKASGESMNFTLDGMAEEHYYWETVRDRFYDRSDRFIRHRSAREGMTLLEQLRGLVNVSWLTIHRSKEANPYHEEESFESTVDKKLHELSTELVKFFSQLDKLSIVERDKFQKSIFLSLISNKNVDKPLALSTLDIEKEKSALFEIFKLFKLSEKDFKKATDLHFKKYEYAYEKIKDDEELELEDFLTLFDTRRIHNVVQDWNDLTTKQGEIYKPRDTFLSVVNRLMQRKEIQINDRNELIVYTKSGKVFPLKNLSSGEKQLLIILGEALLQKLAPWIYIADEPELSLHVSWQESLVRNLRRLNPNAQIIFATHSPDIVSTFSNCIFDMEKILS